MFLSWVRGLSSLFTGRAVLPTGIAATKGKSLRTQQRGNTVIAADALVRHEQKTYSISIRLVVVPGWDDLSELGGYPRTVAAGAAFAASTKQIP